MAYLPCPHCGLLHDVRLAACPTTGQALQRAGSPAAGRTPPRHAAKHGEHAPDLSGTVVDGKYRILAVLGRGGMGTVYEAENLSLGRRVAIKVLHPSQAKKRVAVKRFHQEARAAGRIGHPNICEVYDLGTLQDGSPYLVMEKLSGETLAMRIARTGGMPLRDVVDVLVQVLSGLYAAHEQGIIHRDIKPENVMLTPRVGMAPVAKVLDFGVSKMMYRASGDDDDEGDLTKTGMVMGTPYYMSAEQARGERNLDGRVDVYACGVMTYEALTGKRPFFGKTYNTLLMAILTNPYTPATELRADLPPDVDRVIARAMARKREERYASAAELQRDLAALGQSAREPPPAARETKRSASPRRAPALGVLPDLSSRGSSSDDIPVIDMDGPYGTTDEPTIQSAQIPRSYSSASHRRDFDDVTIKQASPFDDAQGEGETRRVDPKKLSREATALDAAQRDKAGRDKPPAKPDAEETDPLDTDDATVVAAGSPLDEAPEAPPGHRH